MDRGYELPRNETEEHARGEVMFTQAMGELGILAECLG